MSELIKVMTAMITAAMVSTAMLTVAKQCDLTLLIQNFSGSGLRGPYLDSRSLSCVIVNGRVRNLMCMVVLAGPLGGEAARTCTGFSTGNCIDLAGFSTTTVIKVNTNHSLNGSQNYFRSRKVTSNKMARQKQKQYRLEA